MIKIKGRFIILLSPRPRFKLLFQNQEMESGTLKKSVWNQLAQLHIELYNFNVNSKKTKRN